MHLVPDLGHQATLAGQVAGEPAPDQVAVLEEEEHQDRHQHQVDHDVDQQRQARQREGQRPLAELAHLAAGDLDGLEHLLIGHQVRVALGQQQQQRLPFAEHPRQLLEQGAELLPEQRHQHTHDQRQDADEEREDDPYRQGLGQPQALQQVHQPLHEEGQHQPGKYRCEHVAEGKDSGEAEYQDHGEHHGLFIGEIALNPVAKHLEHWKSLDGPDVRARGSGLAQPVAEHAVFDLFAQQLVPGQLRESAEIPLGAGVGGNHLEHRATGQAIELELGLEQRQGAVQAAGIQLGVESIVSARGVSHGGSPGKAPCGSLGKVADIDT
ncbi:hypothetical protein D9M71_454660 [compost metagenome]